MDKECVRFCVQTFNRVTVAPVILEIRAQSRKPDRQLRLESFQAITGRGSRFQIKHVKIPPAHLLRSPSDGPVKLCVQVKHDERRGWTSGHWSGVTNDCGHRGKKRAGRGTNVYTEYS